VRQAVTIVTALLAAQVAAGQPRIGLAELSNGRLCVAVPGPPLPGGSPVTLVRVDPPRKAAVVVVEREGPACEGFRRAHILGPSYVATGSSGMTADDGIWLAVPGRRSTRRRGEVVTVSVGAAHQDARVRSCASNEGLHFTLWAGVPLRSRRLWHQ